MITSLGSWSALARQGANDRGDGGPDLGRQAGGGQEEAEQHADEAVPRLEPGVAVQEPHRDAEQQDQRDRDGQYASPPLSAGRHDRLEAISGAAELSQD